MLSTSTNRLVRASLPHPVDLCKLFRSLLQLSERLDVVNVEESVTGEQAHGLWNRARIANRTRDVVSRLTLAHLAGLHLAMSRNLVCNDLREHWSGSGLRECASVEHCPVAFLRQNAARVVWLNDSASFVRSIRGLVEIVNCVDRTRVHADVEVVPIVSEFELLFAYDVQRYAGAKQLVLDVVKVDCVAIARRALDHEGDLLHSRAKRELGCDEHDCLEWVHFFAVEAELQLFRSLREARLVQVQASVTRVEMYFRMYTLTAETDEAVVDVPIASSLELAFNLVSKK